MTSSLLAKGACLATLLLVSWGSLPLRAGPPGVVNLRSVVVRKGILANGNPTDVEIKEVVPALRMGIDVPPSQAPELAPVPELYAFERINHAQDLTVEMAKKLVCHAVQSKVTKEIIQEMIQDEKTFPARHRIWVRYLVFITQSNLKVMFVDNNFEPEPPKGAMAASTYFMEDGVWKPWVTDVKKMLELTHAFSVGDANNLKAFFHEDK